ncbi:hypothetical protein BpHYR1_040193, partial [Brachionus plicatilis]
MENSIKHTNQASAISSGNEEAGTERKVQTRVVVYQQKNQLTELNQQYPEQTVKAIKTDDTNSSLINQTTTENEVQINNYKDKIKQLVLN